MSKNENLDAAIDAAVTARLNEMLCPVLAEMEASMRLVLDRMGWDDWERWELGL